MVTLFYYGHFTLALAYVFTSDSLILGQKCLETTLEPPIFDKEEHLINSNKKFARNSPGFLLNL